MERNEAREIVLHVQRELAAEEKIDRTLTGKYSMHVCNRTRTMGECKGEDRQREGEKGKERERKRAKEKEKRREKGNALKRAEGARRRPWQTCNETPGVLRTMQDLRRPIFVSRASSCLSSSPLIRPSRKKETRELKCKMVVT